MRLEPNITIRNLPRSDAIEGHIRDKIEKLDNFCPRIMSCRVVLEQSQKSKHQGKLYNARIDVTVPGHELAVNRIQDEDLYVAIRDAFFAARRKLQNLARRQRGEVKAHELPLHGRILRVYPKEEFGFIESNGDEYYFSRTNVAYPGFDELEIGTEVTFLAAPADDGLHANRVTAGKHHSPHIPEE